MTNKTPVAATERDNWENLLCELSVMKKKMDGLMSILPEMCLFMLAKDVVEEPAVDLILKIDNACDENGKLASQMLGAVDLSLVVNIGNFFRFLTVSLRLRIEPLKDACINYASSHILDILKEKEFFRLKYDAIDAICSLNRCHCINCEIFHFRALRDWLARYPDGDPKYRLHLLRSIHLDCISNADLLAEVDHSGLYDERDILTAVKRNNERASQSAMEPPADSASVSRTKIFIDYECPGAKETSRIVIALAPLTAPLFVRHAFKTPSGHCLLKLDMLTIGPSKCLISAMPHLALHKDEAYHSFTHLGRGGLNAGSFFYVPEKSFFTKSAFHIAIATVEEANSDAILLGNVVQGLEKFSEQMKQNVDQAERVRITAYGKL